MADAVQATFQRVRHAVRQSGDGFAGDAVMAGEGEGVRLDGGSGDLGRRRETFVGEREGGSGGGVGAGRGGGGRQGSGRLAAWEDDGKPLLPGSASFEFREKEKRFVKGQFVIPGSDVQQKIAEAMASMLAAGGRAVSGTSTAGGDGSSSPSGSTVKAHGGDGYRQILHDDSAGSSEGRDCNPRHDADARARTGTSSGEPDGVSRGAASWPAGSSPRRRLPLYSEEYFVGAGAGPEDGRAEGPEAERECVICMEEFTKEDPEMLTLCSCGVNKTFFHYACLLQWLAKHSYCPACRGYLFFEERHRVDPDTPWTSGEGGRGVQGGEHPGNIPSGSSRRTSARDVSDEDYRRAFHRVLRAGLEFSGDNGGGSSSITADKDDGSRAST